MDDNPKQDRDPVPVSKIIPKYVKPLKGPFLLPLIKINLIDYQQVSPFAK